jgi:rhodanese-related sulfurtransferase
MYFNSFAQSDDAALSVSQLKEKMATDTTLIVLDVRTPEELVGPLGKLENVINIPVQDLESRVKELDVYKKKEIAVICRTGHRSHIATMFLIQHGFKVKNVLGGMVEYRQEFK